jgi:hypothetical protein
MQKLPQEIYLEKLWAPDEETEEQPVLAGSEVQVSSIAFLAWLCNLTFP